MTYSISLDVVLGLASVIGLAAYLVYVIPGQFEDKIGAVKIVPVTP
ncbi:MAG: hypothetical protein HQL43_06385 [Alphaproteobacteria bacterium]|nr:hypothetical protein [Alphaproteobacteria bacterium]